MLKKFDIFNNLNEDVLLAEALNNPKEYYMTDDTILPSKIYAVSYTHLTLPTIYSV